MKTEKGFYRNFFSIYIVLVLQNVVTISVNLADNVMLGGYSETALSGVAAVNQIQFVYQQLLMALGDGLVIFCSQYWGKRQTEPMRKISSVAMRAGLFIAVVLFAAVSLFPQRAVGLFTTEESIIREGAAYLGIVKYTYVFFAVTIILLATLRSVETVKIAFWLSVMAFCVNCCINYVLIYGRFGAPELGAKGAAIGTLAARIAECAVLLVYIAKKEKKLHLQLKDYFRADRLMAGDYFRVCLPMLVVQGLWGLPPPRRSLWERLSGRATSLL